MDSTERLHELIHTNLCVLRRKGHKINFEQDMFKRHNIPGFEEVGYGLLKIINQAECKKSLPWPLISDHKQKSEFRTNFSKFIKGINVAHPEARIPEVTASSLQFPGGEKFVRFMYRLSTFAVELELKRMLSPEEQSTILPKPQTSKSKEVQMFSINKVKGARWEQEALLQQQVAYQESALPALRTLECSSKALVTNIDSLKTKLKDEIYNLAVDEEAKKRLLELEDSDVMTDWNIKTKEKINELENRSQEFCRFQDQTSQGCQLLRQMKEPCAQPVVLDGSKVNVTSNLEKLADGPLMNQLGQLRLNQFLTVTQKMVSSLSSPDGSQAHILLPQAKNLLAEAPIHQSSASRVLTVLEQSMADDRRVLKELVPVVYAKMREKKAPEYLKYLKAPSPAKYIKPQFESTCASATQSPAAGQYKNAMMADIFHALKKRLVENKKKRVIASYKHRSVGRMFMTPAAKNSRTPYHSTAKSRYFVPSSVSKIPSVRFPEANTLMSELVASSRKASTPVASTTATFSDTRPTPVVPAVTRPLVSKVIPTSTGAKLKPEAAKSTTSGSASSNSKLASSKLVRPKSKASLVRKSVSGTSASKTDIIHNINVGSSSRLSMVVEETPARPQDNPAVNCRRSLYGRLPTGARVQHTEDFNFLSPIEDDLSEPSSTSTPDSAMLPAESEASGLNPPQPKPKRKSLSEPSSTSTPDSATLPAESETSGLDPPHPKPKRKSLCDLIDRYLKVKESMDKKNEPPKDQ